MDWFTFALRVLVLSFFCAAAPPAMAVETKVGALLPLTGYIAPLGESLRQGIELAVDEIKDSSYGRVEIVLTIRDTQSDPRYTAQAADALLLQDGVEFLVGGPLSTAFPPTANKAERHDRVFIALGGAALPANRTLNDYEHTFHVGYDISLFVEIVRHVRSKTGLNGGFGWCAESAPSDRRYANDNQFYVCPKLFMPSEAWRRFDQKIRSRSNGRSRPNLYTALGYIGMKALGEAILATGGDLREVPEILRERTFDTLQGPRRFGDGNRLISAYPVIAFSPRLRADGNFGAYLEQMEPVAEDSCDDCKTNGECPQGMSLAVVAEDDCCEDESECPQGMVLY
jgi:ABC-type branched-subunit amino acid transport system substrate-binding protein